MLSSFRTCATPFIRTAGTCTVTLLQPLANEQNAEHLVQAGLLAMKQWEDDPMRGVEATINLIKARDIYQAGENWEKVQELNAHIFWCKKKMTNDQIDALPGSEKTG